MSSDRGPAATGLGAYQGKGYVPFRKEEKRLERSFSKSKGYVAGNQQHIFDSLGSRFCVKPESRVLHVSGKVIRRDRSKPRQKHKERKFLEWGWFP